MKQPYLLDANRAVFYRFGLPKPDVMLSCQGLRSGRAVI
jgi:hypothetical protein